MKKIVYLNNQRVDVNNNNNPFLGRVPLDLEVNDQFEEKDYMGATILRVILDKQVFPDGTVMIRSAGV